MRWSRRNAWFIHGNLIGSNSSISMPFALIAFRCFFFRGLLLELFPKESNRALISTPSSAFFARRSNSALAIESFLKLKYSRCMWCLAFFISSNKSINFSWPLLRIFTSLLVVVCIPYSFRYSMIVESLLLLDPMISVAYTLPFPMVITIRMNRMILFSVTFDCCIV